jgi:hypothetical protein
VVALQVRLQGAAAAAAAATGSVQHRQPRLPPPWHCWARSDQRE